MPSDVVVWTQERGTSTYENVVYAEIEWGDINTITLEYADGDTHTIEGRGATITGFIDGELER